MAGKSFQRDARHALRALATALAMAALPALAQQSVPNNPPPAAAKVPPADAPVAAGKGPMRLPAPAEPAVPQPPAGKPFTPSEQVRADADVAFPADI